MFRYGATYSDYLQATILAAGIITLKSRIPAAGILVQRPYYAIHEDHDVVEIVAYLLKLNGTDKMKGSTYFMSSIFSVITITECKPSVLSAEF